MKLLQGSSLCLNLGGNKVLQDVDIDLEPGEILGLIGPNGAGKSCLLRLLAGLHKPRCGSLRLAGQPLFELTIEERAQQIAWLAQQGEIHWPISVETLLELGRSPRLAPWRGLNAKDREAVEQVLRETALMSLRERPVDTLSGGEQARALLARALVGEPRILLADEPLAALDPAHQLDMMQLLQSYCREDNGIIVVLHDLRFAANFCQRLLLLHEGKVIAAGPPSQVLTAENLARTYEIEIKPGERDLFTIPWQSISSRP